jgi:hypothetical protein
MSIELTQEVVHELLSYDPSTGTLTWRKRARNWFQSDGDCKKWNTRYANKPALTHTEKRGVLSGRVLSRNYLAHRVIWLWMTGQWPTDEIDHKNRDPADNRWRNLREATRKQNGRNLSMSKRNKSHRIGVGWDQSRRRFYADNPPRSIRHFHRSRKRPQSG